MTTQQQALAAVKSAGSKAAAARELGITRSKLRRLLDKPSIDQTKFKQICKPSGKETRVLVLPDAHDNPRLPKDRFDLMGIHATEGSFDYLVSIGDIADFESLCSQMPNDTMKGRGKGTFMDDMESLEEALMYIDSQTQCGSIKKVITLGNHEHRIWKMEDQNPEIAGLMKEKLLGTLEQYGWEVHPYGAYVGIAGVDFTHIPFNKMGRPIGGKYVTNTLGREAVRDTVIGHTHNAGVHTAPKIGGTSRRVRIVEVGCALPWGMMADYAEHSQTSWWWGVVELTIIKGQIEGWNFIPMYTLERLYK